MQHLLTTLRLLIVAALISSAIPATAQPGLASEGREFWLGFMPNYITPAQAISVYVGTAVPNDFKVETFGAGGSIVRSQSIKLGAGQSHKFNMSVGLSETRDREEPVYRAIRVTSSSPSTVVGYSDNSLTTDGFLAIPTPALGLEHYCFSYFDDSYSPGIDHLGGEFLVVAPYDDTKVTITTTARTSLTDDGKTIGHTPGQTWTVTLKRGQTYLVQSTGWEYGVGDLTGSKVTSNKPVGFLSGHQRAAIELEDGNSKDHLVEMIPSTNHWGIEYFGIPQNARTICGNYYRVMSAENDNVIKVNDSTVTLDAGEYAVFSQMTDVAHFISTNKKRFLAMEYFYSQGQFGDPGPGDPDMLTLTPASGFVTHAIFRTPSNAGTAFRHYATFVAATDGINSLRLKKGNTSPLSVAALGGSIVPIENTSYSFARIRMPGDEISWFAECDVPFSLDLYGYADVESYGYPGSRNFTISSDSIAPRLRASAADSCGSYSLTLTDDVGIADIYLIPPSERDRFGINAGSSNYTFTTAAEFRSGDTVVKLTASVTDASKDASLALYVVDKGGNDTTFTAAYTARPILWSLDDPFPAITRLGDTVCRTVTMRNMHSDSISFTPRTMHPRSAFRLSPVGNFRIGPGDSMQFELCFIPEDTLTYVDSVAVITECYTSQFVAVARSAQGKIYATDRYFGMGKPGEEICNTIQITNPSEVPITVLGYTQTGDTVFAVRNAIFPITLQPGESKNVEICFTPTRDSSDFSSQFDWILDRPTTLNKTYTIVSGITRRPSSVSGAQDIPFDLWPNPALDHVNISVEEGLSILSITAADLLGRSYALSTSDSRTISVSGLPTGVYTISISTTKGQIARQLVIKR